MKDGIKGKMLTKADAEALFDENAVLLSYTCNAIPFYRVIELFGEEAAAFLESHMEYKGYISLGRDWGSYSSEESANDYLYKCGFLKVVVDHNNRIAVENHKNSNDGHMWDRYWEKRCRRLDEAEQEEKSKKNKRKTGN